MPASKSEEFALELQKFKLRYFDIANILILFLVALTVLHILAAVISGRSIADLGPLRTPVVLMIYGAVGYFVILLTQLGAKQGLVSLFNNGWMTLMFLILLGFMIWLGHEGNASNILPEIFRWR